MADEPGDPMSLGSDGEEIDDPVSLGNNHEELDGPKSLDDEELDDDDPDDPDEPEPPEPPVNGAGSIGARGISKDSAETAGSGRVSGFAIAVPSPRRLSSMPLVIAAPTNNCFVLKVRLPGPPLRNQTTGGSCHISATWLSIFCSNPPAPIVQAPPCGHVPHDFATSQVHVGALLEDVVHAVALVL
jgi:hypothetical protein